MTSTAFVVGFFLVLLLANVACCALFVRWGARWVGATRVSFRKAVGLVLLVGVAEQLVQWVLGRILSRLPGEGPVEVVALFVIGVFFMIGIFVPCAILASALTLRISRAFVVWLLMLLPSIAFVCLAIFVVRPFMFEAFTTPTNAMAPTLMGRRCTAACPKCQGTAIGSLPLDSSFPRQEERVVICTEQFHTSLVGGPFEEVLVQDRFLVNKLVKPRRWDIVAFKVPEEPSTSYVMRLVGLPGEEVVIRDGVVWIDGQKHDPPESLRGLRYTTTFAIGTAPHRYIPLQVWGSEEYPAKLGPGECFVLGDFSENSRDSRLWEYGAAGHPPYAVPESHIIGVVTHIYWPFSRWRSFR